MSKPVHRTRACPRDHTPLASEKVAVTGPDVTIDKCPTCAGVYLDKNELARITGDLKLNAFLRDAVALDSDSALVCPSCGGLMDMEAVAGAEVEVCLTCFGIWLDKDELEKLKARENARRVPVTDAKKAELQRAKEARRRGKVNPLEVASRPIAEFLRRYM